MHNSLKKRAGSYKLNCFFKIGIFIPVAPSVEICRKSVLLNMIALTQALPQLFSFLTSSSQIHCFFSCPSSSSSSSSASSLSCFSSTHWVQLVPPDAWGCRTSVPGAWPTIRGNVAEENWLSFWLQPSIANSSSTRYRTLWSPSLCVLECWLDWSHPGLLLASTAIMSPWGHWPCHVQKSVFCSILQDL